MQENDNDVVYMYFLPGQYRSLQLISWRKIMNLVLFSNLEQFFFFTKWHHSFREVQQFTNKHVIYWEIFIFT